MRIYLLLVFITLMSACSDTATSEAPKAPPKTPEPITGRQAFQRTFPTARTWAIDCQPLRIHSLILDQVKAEDGKSGAWEVTYVSAQLNRARTYTWSAVEAGGNLHEGVFAGPIESWSGPQGPERPFLPAAIGVDSTDAYQTAVENSKKYLSTPGTKPPVTFLLESTARFPDPAWRVLWGTSINSAEYSVFVDGTTGKFLQEVR